MKNQEIKAKMSPIFNLPPPKKTGTKNRQFAFVWLWGLCIWVAPVWAESDLYTRPQMDAQGNWLTNSGPISGQAQSPQMPGALWRVVAYQLNCRAQPSRHAALITTFRKGRLLQANLGRGGSDEVMFNALDRAKNPWMWVRSAEGHDLGCFVRAHRSFIQPLQSSPQPAK